MVLLQRPPHDCSDASQIQEFAYKNKKILELFTSGSLTTEETEEIAKYRDFYRYIELAAGLAVYKKDDENAIRTLGAKLAKMTKEAETRQNLVTSKVLRSLYYDFVDQHDHLMEILKFVFQKVCAMKSEDANSKRTTSFDYSRTGTHKNVQTSGTGCAIELGGNANSFSHFSPNEFSSQLQCTGENPVFVERCKVKSNCMGVQTSLMSETKGTQTETAVADQDTAGDLPTSVPNADYHCIEGQQKLQPETSNSTNSVSSGVPRESVFKLTNSQRKLNEEDFKMNEEKRKEMLQKLSKIGNSAFISSEDIQNRLNPQAREFENGGRYVRKTLETARGSSALVKSPSTCRSDPEDMRPNLVTVSHLRTLEEFLKFFGLFPRLQQLEKSLEDVRRRRRTVADHEAECKRLDKDLQKLSRDFHPDSVMRRGGSAEEVTHAKELQTALNATRTVLNAIHKVFLEDIDIDHRYEFFTKLDIGLLGNEDEVENRVYEVLFKISLVSDIKQENIIAEIRRFLTAAQHCVKSYVRGDSENFVNLRHTAFFYLKRCAEGYRKLHAELAEVEEECRSEKLHNIYPLLRRMGRDCSEHLKHLEALIELMKLPLGEHFQMYNSSLTVDDYFILPFIRYVNVIMTCSLMFKNDNRKSNSWSVTSLFHRNKNLRSPARVPLTTVRDDDKISELHYLATQYRADDYYNSDKKAVKEQFGRGQHLSKDYIKEEFIVRLMDVQEELSGKFKIDDYEANGTTRHIMKELKICKEMKAEFEAKSKEVENYIKQMNENNESMKKRLDTLFLNSQKVSHELSESLADSKMFKDQIEKLTGRKMSDIMEKDFFPE